MRGCNAVKGGNQKKIDYYAKDKSLKKAGDYYSVDANSESRATTAVWVGAKSQRVGLVGHADQETVEKLFAGIVPSGQRMRGEKTSGEDVLAVDFTLSAPKSFSIHAVNDLRLFDAHMEAVEEAIADAERHYCYQRIQVNGIRQNVMADGFIAVAIPHWDSREAQIQLHLHTVIFNGLQGPDGKWRAFDDRQLGMAEWIGSHYRNLLAQKTQFLGYKIHEKKLDGGGYSFEIDGITDEQIEHFSKRTEQVEAAKAKGMSRQDAKLLTRKAKDEELTFEEIRDNTNAELAVLSAQLQTPQNHPIAVPIGRTNASYAVDYAIAHLSRESCKFTKGNILKVALDHMERFSLLEVESAIAIHPELIDYGVVRNRDELRGLYTTASALEREIGIIQRWHRGDGQATPIMDRAKADATLKVLEARGKAEFETRKKADRQKILTKIANGDKSKKTAKALERLEKKQYFYLNDGQRGAVQGILATDNNHAIVRGLSGVGKTSSMKKLKAILDEQGIETVWCATSLEAAKKLSDSVGVKAITLQRIAYTDYELKPGQILFVDEFGLADAEVMDRVGVKVEAVGARIVPIGDEGQNKPIAAGAPMKSLMDYGAEVFKISEILRQQNSIQKSAVELIANGHGLKALKLLDDNDYVTEIQDPDERVEAIAQYYLSLSKEERKETYIITGTNREKDAITAKVRDGLKEEGALGESRACIKLQNKNYSPGQTKDIRNYEVGDYVSPSRRTGASCPFQKDRVYKVVGKTDTRLLLESPDGSTFEINPTQYEKTVFSAHEIDIAAGDELRWTSTIKSKGIENGETFTVQAIEGKTATIIDRHGNERTINFDEPLPIDYDLTATTYRIQGSDRPRAILCTTDDQTSNQGSVYVGISRQIEHLIIFTQNYAELLKRVARECTHDSSLDLLELNYDDRSADFDGRDGRIAQDFQDVEIASRRSGRTDAGINEARGWTQQASVNDGKHDRNGGKKSANPESIRDPAKGTDRYPESPIRDLGLNTRELERLAKDLYQVQLSKQLEEPLQRFEIALKALQNTQDELNHVTKGAQALKVEVRAKMKRLVDNAKLDVLSTVLAQVKREPNTRAQTAVSFALSEMSAIYTRATAQSIHPPERLRIATEKPRQHTKPPMPQKYEAFWWPNYSKAKIPDGFKENHWNEVMGSAIHPDLIQGNMEIASGESVTQKLAKVVLEDSTVSDFSKENLREKYEPVVTDGFWFNGGYDIKALATAQAGDLIPRTNWGVYKSFTPRLDQEKTQRKGEPSYRKYENPIGQPREFFMPVVPSALADPIYKKYGIDPTAEERASGLYFVALKYNLPIVITEGDKKTMASLSQGHVTIGMQGVNALYRARDDDGNRLPQRVFNEDFACWTTPGRQITFAFDADSKPSSVVAVRRAMVHSIELLQERGGNIRVAKWRPEQGKGLDDLIVQSGPKAWEIAVKKAVSPEPIIDAHYRYDYTQRRDQFRAKYAEASETKIDQLIYKEMIEDNPQDAERVLRQSDRARTLKDPARVQEYIEQIEATEQKKQDRAAYEVLAARVRNTSGEISDRVVDMQVYLIAEQEGQPGDGDRLIAQSDRARSLPNPQEVLAYIESIKTEAKVWLQQTIETARANRTTYERLTEQVTQEMGAVPVEQRDMEIYLRAQNNSEDAEGILAQSDKARTLTNPNQVTAYIEHVKAEAPAYAQQQRKIEIERIHSAIDSLVARMGDGDPTESLFEHEGYIIARQGESRGVFRAEDKQPVFKDGTLTDSATGKDSAYVSKLPQFAAQVNHAAEVLQAQAHAPEERRGMRR